MARNKEIQVFSTVFKLERVENQTNLIRCIIIEEDSNRVRQINDIVEMEINDPAGIRHFARLLTCRAQGDHTDRIEGNYDFGKARTFGTKLERAIQAELRA
jgi:hypothetical protein